MGVALRCSSGCDIFSSAPTLFNDKLIFTRNIHRIHFPPFFLHILNILTTQSSWNMTQSTYQGFRLRGGDIIEEQAFLGNAVCTRWGGPCPIFAAWSCLHSFAFFCTLAPVSIVALRPVDWISCEIPLYILSVAAGVSTVCLLITLLVPRNISIWRKCFNLQVRQVQVRHGHQYAFSLLITSAANRGPVYDNVLVCNIIPPLPVFTCWWAFASQSWKTERERLEFVLFLLSPGSSSENLPSSINIYQVL